MNRDYAISEKWIKASVIGTIWAASEIVFGSFLHNLRVPFSSNVLTGIGLIILISTSYKWTEKGLYWRAGLICALMKTMSPSAIIFGPMIAIFSQSLILELFTRVLGKRFIGFALGAMFAMSWNLVHKILNLIISYGFNLVNVYADLLKYVQRQLNTNMDLVWSPILILVLIYSALGLLSAIIGMRVGKRLISQPAEKKLINHSNSSQVFGQKMKNFNYSIPWLIIDVLLLVTAFVLLSYAPWYIWTSSIAAIATVWIIRYKRALRKLKKPSFWAFFIIITMLTAFVVTRIQSKDLTEGLLIGLQMNFRAIAIILGFSVLGTELYNPKIREFFLKTSFKQLPLALELSFESLPIMIASVPELKVILRNPVQLIYQVISQIDFRLDDLRNKLARKVFIITGTVGEGKTTQVQKIVNELQSRGIPSSGIYSPRIMELGQTTGYDVVDIETGGREPFLRLAEIENHERIGRYSILPKGYDFGRTALKRSKLNNSRLVIIDEVGRLDLDNQGWAENIDELVNSSQFLIFAVRDVFADEVVKKWDLKDYSIFKVSDNPYQQVSEMLISHLS
ncbi:MAG: nucleoside-triphosphatase [Bacteroidales bacterium]|nr:nucleoside-triphosphatase [Bacteroidales bacterium]MDD4671518.1 nucleoside-triphosphatase [Bacteroidales bacterium]